MTIYHINWKFQKKLFSTLSLVILFYFFTFDFLLKQKVNKKSDIARKETDKNGQFS